MERIAFEFCQLKNSLSICSGEKEDSLKQNNVKSSIIQYKRKLVQKRLQQAFKRLLKG